MKTAKSKRIYILRAKVRKHDQKAEFMKNRVSNRTEKGEIKVKLVEELSHRGHDLVFG